MSKIKNSGLEQYGAKPFERQQLELKGLSSRYLKNSIHSVIKTKLNIKAIMSSSSVT